MKAYCYDDFVNEHDSVEEAVKEAEDALDEYRTNASDDGWHEEVERVCVFVATHETKMEVVATKPPDDEIDEDGYDKDNRHWGDFDKYVDYHLRETEAGKLLRLAPAVIEAAKKLWTESDVQRLMAVEELLKAVEAFEAATSEGTDGKVPVSERAAICHECDKRICKSGKPCGFVGCPFPSSWWKRTSEGTDGDCN